MRAKKKTYDFSMNFGTLPGYVMVLVNEDWKSAIEAATKKLKRANNKGWQLFLDDIKDDALSAEFALGMAFKRKNAHGIYYGLFMRGFDFNNPKYHTALAHEIVHLCQYHLPDFMHRDLEHEFEAYTHSHLMDQFYAEIKK